jgi:hypothetical protein
MRFTLPLSAALLALSFAGCGEREPSGAGRVDARPTEHADSQPPVRAESTSGEVRVRTVALFSSGVGYIEHAGEVDGSQHVDLRVRSEQIDDILKSLLLEDLDGGRAGVVEYPSLDPLEKTLASFQVNLTGDPTLAQLLQRLRGARVSVAWQDQHLSGTILGVETRTAALGDSGRTTERPVLDLADGGTTRQIPLDEARELSLEDEHLRDELGKALAAIAVARDQDKKTLGIGFDGQGKRRVRFGYVVETPVWKTSYRLVMPAKKGDDAHLQGWAIVENQTDQDWTDVRLSLVSGRPISFRENLSQPLYVPRPVVEPELYASLRPQQYRGGMAADRLEEQQKQVMGGRRKGERDEAKKVKEAEGKDAAAAQDVEELAEQAPVTATAIDAISSVASAAAADKLGELFHYTVASVTLPRQRSAMLPIVTDPIQVERVTIFNESVLATHPLDGALLTNSTGKHLLQGPITVLDGGGYAGDASIEDLPPGDHRLISYAIDIPVKALVERTEITGVLTAKIVDGVLQVSSRHQAATTYRFENGADEDRTVVIEHPRPGQDWKLGEGPKPFEETPGLYRWKLPVAAGKSDQLVVHEELIDWQGYGIADFGEGNFEAYLSESAIPEPVKKALAKAAAMKRELAALQRRIDDLQAELTQIAEDQNRLRENMKTVAQNSPYSQRLLTKLNDQETQVEGKQKEQEERRAALEAKRKELADYLAGLNVQ